MRPFRKEISDLDFGLIRGISCTIEQYFFEICDIKHLARHCDYNDEFIMWAFRKKTKWALIDKLLVPGKIIDRKKIRHSLDIHNAPEELIDKFDKLWI